MMNYQRQHGLSIIELMVAIALSMILILGVFQIFSASRHSSQVQTELARLQENARFALDVLSHDIRMAGKLGCNSTAKLDSNSSDLPDFDYGIHGYEDTSAYSNLPITLLKGNSDNPDSTDVTDGTDSIKLSWASAIGTSITSFTDTSVFTVASSNSIGIDDYSPLVIGNCKQAETFIAKEIKNNKISTYDAEKLLHNYDTSSQVYKLNAHAYYVGTDINGIKNLYQSYITASTSSPAITTYPLIEGIEDLQIEYGVNINGSELAIKYVPANQMSTTDWEDVSSVRLHLLLATPDKMRLAQQPQKYWFPDSSTGEITLHTAADNDLRLFRSFTTTIQLRNKGFEA